MQEKKKKLQFHIFFTFNPNWGDFSPNFKFARKIDEGRNLNWIIWQFLSLALRRRLFLHQTINGGDQNESQHG